MPNYKECWWAHGQKKDGNNERVQNLESSTNRINDMVQDIVASHFDWEQDRDQSMNFDVKTFHKLLEKSSEPLQPGCTKQTTLSTVTTKLNINNNMSHEYFEQLLKAIKSILHVPDVKNCPITIIFVRKW